jgi:hypothetical protein
LSFWPSSRPLEVELTHTSHKKKGKNIFQRGTHNLSLLF